MKKIRTRNLIIILLISILVIILFINRVDFMHGVSDAWEGKNRYSK